MLQIYDLMKNLENIVTLACTILNQWSINNYKVKYSEFGQKVSDIFEHVLKIC